jgi:hypothetical protein
LGLVLGLASAILRQYLVEDVVLKFVDALRKTEEQFLARCSSEPAAVIATSKIRG